MKAHSKIIAMMSILVIAYLVDVATAGIAMMRRMKPPGNMYETIVACFGSRYSLNPRPQDREWYQAPAGRFRDEHVETILGLRVDERIYTLPFHQLNIPIFSKVQQTVRPCTLIWRAIIPEASITLTISIIAPFYPRDAKLSTAPFFYVDFAVENLSERKRNGMVIYARALDSHQLNRLRLARDIAIFESTGAF
ncbi:MAG TPA: hypothetical protein EYP10_05405, partial [Armatimonadetes bacterium]|nr:hypothetical protein [Armatimonadota bacterium]